MTIQRSVNVTYQQLFSVSGFSQLASGALLARTANRMWGVALVLFVLERFHSPALAGLAIFLAVAPGLAISPVAGALLDRHGRLGMILLDYSVAAASMLALVVCNMVGLLSPQVLLVIVAIGSLTGPLSASGTRSLFPVIVPRELWDRANAVDSGSEALSSTLGPVLAGLVFAWYGGSGAFVVTAVIFGMAALALIGVADPGTEHPTEGPLLRSAWQALVYVVTHPSLRGLIVTLWMGNLGFGVLTVALPVLILRHLHGSASLVGVVWAVAGVSTIVSGLTVGRFNSEGRERSMVALGMGIVAIGFIVVAATGTLVGLFVGMLIFGLSSGPVDIGLFSLRQRRTHPAWFGRAFAVSMSLNFAGMPVGSALAGPIVEHSVVLALLLAAALSVAGIIVPFIAIPREG